MTCIGGGFGFSLQEFCNEEARGPHPSGKNIPEDPAWGLICEKTSESEKTSSCIEFTMELEGEQDLDLGGRGGASKDWHLLGGKGGGFIVYVLDRDVKIDAVSNSLS